MKKSQQKTKDLLGVTVLLSSALLAAQPVAAAGNNHVTSDVANLTTSTLSQQAKKTSTNAVSGKVVDEKGEPLVGAVVSIPGTSVAVFCDLEGEFNLMADKGTELLISCVGFEPAKVTVGDAPIDVTLKENTSILDEVVVIGYGTTERKRVTTAITSIKGDDLTKGIGGSTVATAIQGKIPGLTIDAGNNPNANTPGFQLRGVASVNSSTGPLIVIDGIPGGDIRSINQEDIESIDVLKDASAGAIYGTRAAGGVILITTKGGQAGKAKVTYTAEVTLDHIRKRPEMLSAQEFVAEGLGYDYGSSTDWYGEMVNDNAFSDKHTVTLTGGSEKAKVYASMMYNKDNGLIKKLSRTDYSGRINADFKVFDGKVDITTRLQVRQSNRLSVGSESSLNNAMTLNPTIPLMDPDDPTKYNVSKDGLGGTTTSPVADVEYRDYHGRDQWVTATGALTYHVIPGLDLHGSANIDYRAFRSNSWYQFNHLWCIENSKKGYSQHTYSEDTYNSYEAYANYHKYFGDHFLDAVAGWSYWESNGEAFNAANSDFTIEGVGPWNLGEGSSLKDGIATMGSSKDSRLRLMAFFARVNYAYDDKYIFSASFRREGSSKFGVNNRWGNFWALSGGWRLNREEFMKDIAWLNDLKIRVAYGVTGNNGLPAGLTTQTYVNYGEYPYQGVWQNSYGPQKNINQNIKWEMKKELNIGFDFSLFNERLWGRFDWYHRRVDDLIYKINVPQPPNIYSSVYDNIGSLTNTGWEAEIGGMILNAGGVQWTSTLRAFGNSSKIKKLGDEGSYVNSESLPDPGSPGALARLSANSNIGQFWVYRNAGVDENGKWLIYDKDNNIVPASKNLGVDNRVYKGNALPRVIFSMDHTVTYKNFDLGLQLRAWVDFDIYNGYCMYKGIGTNSQYNVLRDYYYDHKEIKDNEKVISDYFMEDGSFLKIDALTLGYTLNLSKYTKYLDKFRVYLTIRDLATFTKYSGYNPEVNINGLFPGVEWPSISYPQSTRYTLGVQFQF